MTKKSKHEGDVRQFIILSQAWYGDANRKTSSNPLDDEITLGYYCPEGGTSGEFSIRWRELAGRQVPYLRAYDDSWSALAGFVDVIQALGELDDTNPTVDRVAEVLRKCGIQDNTPRESPYKPTAPDIEAVVTLLNIHLDTFEQLRQLGREVSGNPDWAAGFEFNNGVLTGTMQVPRDVVDALTHSSTMIEAYRTKLRKHLEELKDPELTAQYKELAYPTKKS